jgi:type I restriction enzyme S subunit
LVKARFVELFGTLDNPVREFRKATLKELCTKITDGKHGGCTQEEGTDRYFVGAREIYDDVVHYDTAPEINVAEFEKDYKRCNIEIGDFLIVNTGATIGKSAIATDSRTAHTLLQKSVAMLKVKKELLNPVFIKWCYSVNTKMYMVESASAQPNLLLSKINATEIYVPDIELQNQFATFVEQTDKSKLEVQKSLEKLELLKKALMQKYFG